MTVKKKSILLTGAAGFIGSYMLGFLNRNGFESIIITDEFNDPEKISNYSGKKFISKVEREDLFQWLQNQEKIDLGFVIHFGARTDTTEFNYAIHEELNLNYSKQVWNYCAANHIPLIYASSAATYGNGDWGYSDDHGLVAKLNPLNPYGVSKNEFDKWALLQRNDNRPPFWAGLKFFNVYGPNEYHKGRMASVIFHSYNQILQSGKVRLFKSHRADFKDGQQLRDFIYVEDVARVTSWLMVNQPQSGIYNLGTGKARSFDDLVKATFKGMEKKVLIEYIDMPEDIRDKYQYHTEASMEKLRSAGYKENFFSLEEGVEDYVKNFLMGKNYY